MLVSIVVSARSPRICGGAHRTTHISGDDVLRIVANGFGLPVGRPTNDIAAAADYISLNSGRLANAACW